MEEPHENQNQQQTKNNQILIDVRERDLIALMPSHPHAQIPVGDIWIGSPNTNEYAVVAERKTVADLEASILDKRYREQRTRLLAFCAEKKARPLYIIEGNRLSGRTLDKKALTKFLTRLTLRYGVGVLRTSSTQDTANLVEILSEQIVDDPKVFCAETLSYSDVNAITKKGNRDDSENFALACLQQCTGISSDKAQVIFNHFKSLKAILLATSSEVAELKTANGRKIGPAVAKRLCEHFTFSRVENTS